MDPVAERIGRNNAAFREANERIEDTAIRAGIGLVPFICECADRSCTELLRLSLGEYEEVRANPRRFVNVPGHHLRDLGWAIPVEEHERYVVVEKIGAAGEKVEQLDPRQAVE